MKIAISADSGFDLTKEQIKINGIHIIPVGITINGEFFLDTDLSPTELLDLCDKTKSLPKTSAINEFTYKEKFEDLLKTHDAVIHFNLSSGITCSIENAKKAASGLKNVFVVDSLNLSSGIGIQILYACKLKKQKLTAAEIVKKVEERKSSVQTSFVIDKLTYLHRGGRCSSLALLGANLLKIRPSIMMTGSMKMNKKYRGDLKDVVLKYVADTLKTYNTPDLEHLFITHSPIDKNIIDLVKEEVCKTFKFKNIHTVNTCPTISCHCGRGTLGIIYYNDGNK